MKSTLLRQDETTRRAFVARTAGALLGVGMMPHSLRAAGAEVSPLRLQNPKAQNVIYLYMSGGMSHLDTFDVKPGNDVMGATRTMPTSVDGYHISSNLKRMAPLMDRFAVVNSLNSNQGAHEQGNYFMHTSYTQRGTIRHPSMGAWLTKFRGKGNEALPAHAVVGNLSRHPGAGFFDSTFSPLLITNPEEGLKHSRRREGVTESTFNRRLDLASQLDQEFQETYRYRSVDAYGELYDEALSLMKSEDLAAFSLEDESPRLREQYGEDPFGQGCLLARRLVEHGMRFVEVNLGRWDSHVNNFVEVPERCDILDPALSTLIRDLEERGLLESTMVVLATEFGRTPRINQNEGRDHYPQAFTSLIAGGGVKGGTIYGRTDETGSEVIENQIGVEDFNATIAYGLGLPLDHVLFSPSKRPFTVAHNGQPVTELFG